MDDHRRRDHRLLRRLASAGGIGEDADAAAIARLVRDGLAVRHDRRTVLTELGRAALRRQLAGADGFAAQHQVRAASVVADDAGERIAVTLNADESPLARLRRTRGRDGRPLIGDAEYAAGERLRADFTRGRMMPRITSSWSAGVAGRRRGEAGGMAEMSDAIVAARQRVDSALRAVGPDFAGLLLDFCCFLKGIEEIERERLWPVRSAKLVLRLALASLARHYGLAETASGRARGVAVHWGADDYRPEM